MFYLQQVGLAQIKKTIANTKTGTQIFFKGGGGHGLEPQTPGLGLESCPPKLGLDSRHAGLRFRKTWTRRTSEVLFSGHHLVTSPWYFSMEHIMHCISLAIVSQLSRFPSLAIGTNWTFCVNTVTSLYLAIIEYSHFYMHAHNILSSMSCHTQ